MDDAFEPPRGWIRAQDGGHRAPDRDGECRWDDRTGLRGRRVALGAEGIRLPFIDELLKVSWDAAGVKPSPIASDEEFLRRVYLDMLGRIPTLKEAQSFLGAKDRGKRQKLVEYLFEHPDYAKNFGNVWTVLLVGRQRQEREVDKAALSSWLRRQFLDNRRWDRVVFDLVTAKGSNKENGAVNFSLAHMEGGAVPLTSVTSRVFLGLQIQCTQCHDHPSNDWKQADFWGLNAFFKGLRRENVNKADATGADVYDHTELSDNPTDAFSQYDRRNGLVGIAFPRYIDGRKISQGTDIDRRLELGKMLADPGNLDLAKAFVNRMWGHFMGRGIVHPVDDFGAHNPPSNPELLERLAKEFQKSDYDVRALIRWITSSLAYNLTSITTKSNDKDETLFSHMTLKPMTPEQLFDSLLTATSAHKAGGDDASGRRRDQWLRQFVVTFANDEGDEGTSFQGTIPQALEMMNGDLMAQATGGRPGSFLAELLAEAQTQGRTPPVVYMVNNLYLAALSRYPTRTEMTNASRYLNSFPDTIEVLQDLFWALLNSNEFVLNR
ncbi:MAG: DUF1549 and DUF1553 domain-containing protein [Isosphaeraceae bacterium]